MNHTYHRITLALLLIVTPIIFLCTFTLLQVTFDYPDILRKPATYVFQEFMAGGSALMVQWYLMLFASILFIPIAVLLHPVLTRAHTWYMPLATTFGILAGVVQMFGFIRWVFLVPCFAASYLDPSTSEVTRSSIETIFNGFNFYAGVGIGEHLGYIFTALWSMLIAFSMQGVKPFRGWIAWLGMVASIGIVLGTLEPMGLPYIGMINAFAYMIWAIWLVLVGIMILVNKKFDDNVKVDIM